MNDRVGQHTDPMPVNTSSFEELWFEKAKLGDEEAFAWIIERYQVPVYNLCHRMLDDPMEAEDAAQETFLRAYRNLKRFDPERKFINWILTIASNHCVDRIRRRRLRLISMDDLVSDPFVAENAEGPESSMLKQESQEEIQALLRDLRPQDRAMVILKYWYEMSYEEIGEMMSLTVSAVKSRLHRARRAMASQWIDHHGQRLVVNRRSDEASTV
jgi:RNA polymerase sigma-70 factor (ECF subfamily)